MKKIMSIFRGKIPAPAPCDFIRQGSFVVLKNAGAELPEGFPDAISRKKTLKESGSVAAFQCGNGQYFCKIYKYRSFLHSLKRAFRTPRAFRCFAGGRYLAELDFQTPEPVAAAVYYKGFVPLQQILITRCLPPDTVYLDKAVKDADARTAGELLCSVTGFAAKLHQAGFAHGDKSLRNIYLLPDGQSFGLIDLDGIIHYPAGVPRCVAAREVARLISSAYRCYLLPEIPREEWQKKALQSYQDAGGTALRRQDIAGTLARLERHRIPAAKKH